jgi:hypothetical protein
LRLIEALRDLLGFGYDVNSVLFLMQQLVQVLNYYGEDSNACVSPSQMAANLTQANGVLVSIGMNLMSKKSPYSTRFRFMSRCVALGVISQVQYNEFTNEFYLRNASHVPFSIESEEKKTQSPTKLSHNPALNNYTQQMKLATTSFNAIPHSKLYASGFIEQFYFVNSMLSGEDFEFAKNVELVSYLLKQLYDYKLYFV